MKKAFCSALSAAVLLGAVALAPQNATARDNQSSMNRSMHNEMSRDHDDMRHDNGWHRGWRRHCRTVTEKHWSRWQHRWVYTQTRVCR